MERDPLSIVVVATEKELKTMLAALKNLSRKIPLVFQYATQAIEGPAAMNKIVDKTGKLDACFFHHRFTLPGKEPYSEVLGKTLKRKFPNCPVIGFGKKSKAGSRGKNFHEFLETDEEIDFRELLEILMRLQDGDIETKKVKKQYRRLSDLEEGKTTLNEEKKEGESRAFPSNPSFRLATTPSAVSPPGSPSKPLSLIETHSLGQGSPYLNNAAVFSPAPIVKTPYSMHLPGQMEGGFPKSGHQTPNGARTPTTSYGPGQLFLNGTPNAELINQLSQELEKLKNLIYEKRAKELTSIEPQKHLEVKTSEEATHAFNYAH